MSSVLDRCQVLRRDRGELQIPAGFQSLYRFCRFVSKPTVCPHVCKFPKYLQGCVSRSPRRNRSDGHDVCGSCICAVERKKNRTCEPTAICSSYCGGRRRRRSRRELGAAPRENLRNTQYGWPFARRRHQIFATRRTCFGSFPATGGVGGITMPRFTLFRIS